MPPEKVPLGYSAPGRFAPNRLFFLVYGFAFKITPRHQPTLDVTRTSRPFAASSGKTDLSPVYPKLVIVILGVREKIFSMLKGHWSSEESILSVNRP